MKRKSSEFAGRHPAVIFFYILACVIWTMIVRHPAALLLSFAASAVYCVILLGIRRWSQSILAGFGILFFAAVVLPFFSHQGVTPLFYVNGMAVTWESVYYGGMMTVMLLAVLQWCQVAGCLLDSEKLLYFTGRTIPTTGLMLMMIFRAIPDLRDRYRQIHEAQLGLGAVGGEAFLWKRIPHFLREISVLISWALEDSIEVSVSMESRGYRTGKRTWFHLFRFRREDLYWIIFMAAAFFGMFFCEFRGMLKAYYFPEIYQTPLSAFAGIALAAGVSGMIAPAVYDLYYCWYDICSEKYICTENRTDNTGNNV